MEELKNPKKRFGEKIFYLLLRRFLFVAQLVEQLTLNQRVVSSSLTEETKIQGVANRFCDSFLI